MGETKGKKLMLLNRDWLTSAGWVTRFIGVAFEIWWNERKRAPVIFIKEEEEDRGYNCWVLIPFKIISGNSFWVFHRITNEFFFKIFYIVIFVENIDESFSSQFSLAIRLFFFFFSSNIVFSIHLPLINCKIKTHLTNINSKINAK